MEVQRLAEAVLLEELAEEVPLPVVVMIVVLEQVLVVLPVVAVVLQEVVVVRLQAAWKRRWS